MSRFVQDLTQLYKTIQHSFVYKTLQHFPKLDKTLQNLFKTLQHGQHATKLYKTFSNCLQHFYKHNYTWHTYRQLYNTLPPKRKSFYRIVLQSFYDSFQQQKPYTSLQQKPFTTIQGFTMLFYTTLPDCWKLYTYFTKPYTTSHNATNSTIFHNTLW